MSIFTNAWQWFCLNVIPNIHWNFLVGFFHKGKYWKLNAADWELLDRKLRESYYVILVRRNTHLTTYLIAIANKIKVGKWGWYSHALMNLENDVNGQADFRLVQAIAAGTGFATFDKVFDCDSVCLLRPRGFSKEDWNGAMEQCLADVGKPYDTLFNISQDQKLSCVEMVRNALMGCGSVDYEKDFANFEALIKKVGYLTPQMMRDCPDFEVVLEIRR